MTKATFSNLTLILQPLITLQVLAFSRYPEITPKWHRLPAPFPSPTFGLTGQAHLKLDPPVELGGNQSISHDHDQPRDEEECDEQQHIPSGEGRGEPHQPLNLHELNNDKAFCVAH